MTDIEALCKAVNRGSWSALPILADALEDVGDPASAGLRKCLDKRPQPSSKENQNRMKPEGTKYIWVHRPDDDHPCRIAGPCWGRMAGSLVEEDMDYYAIRCYPNRSEAFLDLAQALCAEVTK